MASWGRVVAGVAIGVAGTIYATNEDVRKLVLEASQRQSSAGKKARALAAVDS